MKPPVHFEPRKIDMDGALSTWYKQLEVWKPSRTLTQTVMATKPPGPTLVETKLEKLRREMIEFHERKSERIWFGSVAWRCPGCREWMDDSVEACPECGITRGEKPLGLIVPMIKREPHVQD